MTREEAYNRVDAIIAKHEIDDEYVTVTNEKDYDALRLCRKIIEQEPCEDAISRQEVLDLVVANYTELNGVNVVMYSPLCKDIKQLPPVNPQLKTGHWIEVTNGRGGHECDICHEYAPSYQSGDEYLTKFCPNCGAKIVESQESEDKDV